MVQIEVKNIHKSFKSVQAVRGVSFDIQAGGFVALLGPTGAGKTTLVEIII
jgi:ABC-2 type transport system ATP-binding protein